MKIGEKRTAQGKSLYVVIPANVVAIMKLNKGDNVAVTTNKNQIIIKKQDKE